MKDLVEMFSFTGGYKLARSWSHGKFNCILMDEWKFKKVPWCGMLIRVLEDNETFVASYYRNWRKPVIDNRYHGKVSKEEKFVNSKPKLLAKYEPILKMLQVPVLYPR